MKTLAWVENTRRAIKSYHGFGWSIQGIEKQNKVLTKFVYRFPTGQRTTVLTDIEWHVDNQKKIEDLVEEFKICMEEKHVDLKKAYELINGNKIYKNSKKINWEALTAEFKKDRAANINPRRRVTYKLEECEMVLKDDKEIVGSCNDVILEILFNFYQEGKKEVRRADIVNTAFNTASVAKQTVDNTLGNMVNSKQIRRPKKGIYALTPKDIQRLN